MSDPAVNPSRRLPGLDLMRALAIVWVMLFHTRGLLPPVLDPVSRFGWMGVDVFFVLSGFLIGGQLLRPYAFGGSASIAQFYLRRAFRVLPAYFTVVSLYFLVPGFRESPRLSPLSHFLTFTENFRIDYLHVQAFSHVWSLCVEEHFYLVLPLLVLVLMKRRSATTIAMVAAAVLLIGIAARAYEIARLIPLRDVGDDTFAVRYIERIYYPTYTRLDGLLFGVLLAAIASMRPLWWEKLLKNSYGLLTLASGVTGVAIWLFMDRFSVVATIIGFPVLALGLAFFLLYCVSPSSPLSRIRVLGAGSLATIAYSLYLTHKQIVHLDRVYLSHWVSDRSWLAFFIYSSTVLAAGSILYFSVERPFLEMRERLQRKSRPRTMPQDADEQCRPEIPVVADARLDPGI